MAIEIPGYEPVFENEVYKQDIELTSPYNYTLENGVMKPEVTGHCTRVITFAKFNSLNRAVLERIIQEAETAASIHTDLFSEANMIQNLRKTGRLYPCIHPESDIQRLLLRLPYSRIQRIIDKGYATLESMSFADETFNATARNAEQLPDTLIIRFGVISGTELETEETSNPFFSIGDQLNEELMAGRNKEGFSIHLALKKGKLPNKDELYLLLSKKMDEKNYLELKKVIDCLFLRYASGLEGIDLVPVRDLTADIIDWCTFDSIRRLV